jgi:hypothetical protein
MSMHPSPAVPLPEPQTWRELVGLLIADPEVKRRLADASGIGEVTLRRWASGETTPRIYALRPLVQSLPAYEELLVRLIRKEFPTFSPSEHPQFSSAGEHEAPGEVEAERIPVEVYERVMAAHTSTTDSLRLWTICKHVLRAALWQLDPKRHGLQISIVQCMHPPEGSEDRRVHALWESIEMGTSPWSSELSKRLLFLGSESLAGYAVTSALPAVSQNLRQDEPILPVRQELYEESAAAFPLLRAGQLIAGCLLIASTRQEFFTPRRLLLLERYADLATLGFGDADFVQRGRIDLYPMADTPTQLAAFSDFRRRTVELMRAGAREHHPLSLQQAEQAVRLQLAQELVVR